MGGLNGSLKIDLNFVSFISEKIPMTPESAKSLDGVVCLRSDRVFSSTVVSEYSFHPYAYRNNTVKTNITLFTEYVFYLFTYSFAYINYSNTFCMFLMCVYCAQLASTTVAKKF